jgi:hypothetical protein
VALCKPAPISGVFHRTPFVVVAVFLVIPPFVMVLIPVSVTIPITIPVSVAMFLLRNRLCMDHHWRCQSS